MNNLKQIIEKTTPKIDIFPRSENTEALREYSFYFVHFDMINYAPERQQIAYRKAMEWAKSLTPFQLAEVLATYQIRYEMPEWRDDYR